MSMLQEEYNLTDEELKQLLYDIRHPSMEAAIRREKMHKHIYRIQMLNMMVNQKWLILKTQIFDWRCKYEYFEF